MVDRRRPEYERLTTLLRELRRARGLSQAELGALIGVPQWTVSYFETGERRVDVVELADIARALGVTVPDILDRAEIRGREPVKPE